MAKAESTLGTLPKDNPGYRSYWVSQWLLKVIPKGLVVRCVPRRFLKQHLLGLIRRGDFDTVLEYLLLRLNRNKTRIRWRHWLRGVKPATAAATKTILILGPVRTGKSTIAKKLARHLGYHRVPLDGYNVLLRAIPPGASRDYFRRRLLELVTRFTSRGTVIEGLAEFAFEFKPVGGKQRLFSLEPALSVSQDREVLLAVVGTATSSAQGKLAAIKEHRENHGCWTRKLSEACLQQQAEQIVTLSRDLQQSAIKSGVGYHEIRSDHFADDVEHAVNALVQAAYGAHVAEGSGRLAG